MTRVVKAHAIRRQEIVDTAKQLFLEKDYSKTTMQDIMSTAGIAKGTIYHYFKSKEEMLDAVVNDLVREYISSIRFALDQNHGTALEKMQVLICSGRVAEEKAELIDNLHSSGNAILHTRLLAVTISQLAKLYAEIITQGCEEQIFTTDHPLEAAELIIAGIQFLTDKGFYPWEDRDLSRRESSFPNLIEAQLCAPKGSFAFLLESN